MCLIMEVLKAGRNKRGRLSWQFQIKATNGKILHSSKSYTHKQDCIHAAHLIIYCNEWLYKGWK